MITQLGAWHSYPNSLSSPPNINTNSKRIMYENRNEMPTVCLLWGKDGFTVY